MSDSATPWIAAHQAPICMEFSRQEYWIGLPCPSPGNLQTQESNPGLLHRRRVLYRLNHQGSRRILEWVAYSFSRGSFQPRNWAGSPLLQADSLPAELPGKTLINLERYLFTMALCGWFHPLPLPHCPLREAPPWRDFRIKKKKKQHKTHPQSVKKCESISWMTSKHYELFKYIKKRGIK